MTLTLRVWRQAGPDAPGGFVEYALPELDGGLSLLEALDVLNERLVEAGEAPIAFESDCREGICGSCGVMVNGQAHGPLPRTTTCQVPLRAFPPGSTVTLEPFRARAFPLIRDLVVDRAALDRVIEAGGYVSVRTGSAPEANSVPVAREAAEAALDAAACIGCGACVASCPNGSAALFTGAKLAHLAGLPQGQPERRRRARALVAAADAQGFGGCSSFGECQAVCPKGITLGVITTLNRERLRAVR